MRSAHRAPPPELLSGIRAVTLDFGNTLVPVTRTALRSVVLVAAAAVCPRLGIGSVDDFLAAWADERDRQFREDVPKFREVELPRRAVRVLARMRGVRPPQPDDRWDDAAAAGRSTEGEISMLVDAYSGAFVDGIPAPAGSGRIIAELADRGFLVAILSNWPLASTIDRFAERAGWLPFLHGVYVSERIGTIKPHPAVFEHAASDMRMHPAQILHVGDDWAADVAGALGAGWHAAYLTGHQADTSLPTSEQSDHLRADLVIAALGDLSSRLSDPTA
ncbi:MAG: HAD family hydrolase [Chloroflexota bacterium]